MEGRVERRRWRQLAHDDLGAQGGWRGDGDETFGLEENCQSHVNER